jgi:putative FmdB family regulatory protein
MPIYEYRCDEGHEVEVIQPITEEPLEKCPECGAPARRVLHSPAIHFKGPGFHNTDYGTKTRNKAGESSDSGSGGGESAPAGDSKPDTATSESNGSKSGKDSAKGAGKSD